MKGSPIYQCVEVASFGGGTFTLAGYSKLECSKIWAAKLTNLVNSPRMVSLAR